MAKSSIIKEVIDSKINISTSLFRLKSLLYNFNKIEIIQWINNEIFGYSVKEELPAYRIFDANLHSTFRYAQALSFNKDVYMPNNCIPDEYSNVFKKLYIFDCIDSIHLSKLNSSLIPLPTSTYDIIIEYGKVKEIKDLYHMFYEKDKSKILSSVQSKVLDILLLLEKEFGNLDEYDINLLEKETNDLNRIELNIYNIIYSDNRKIEDTSITIGNDNTIEESSLTTHRES